MSEILELQSLDDTSANLLDTSKKLIYSNTIDTTNIQNILLISSKIHDSKLFYDSVNDNTFPIIYSFNSVSSLILLILTFNESILFFKTGFLLFRYSIFNDFSSSI